MLRSYDYDLLTNSFLEVANKHGLLKKKTIMRNQDSFVNEEHRKAIYTRSRWRDKMCQNLFYENINADKKQRNKCVTLRRQKQESLSKTKQKS